VFECLHRSFLNRAWLFPIARSSGDRPARFFQDHLDAASLAHRRCAHYFAFEAFSNDIVDRTLALSAQTADARGAA
jgi:hypothetical protein